MNKRKIITAAAIILVIVIITGLLILRLRKRPVTQLEDAKTVYMNAADATGDIHDYVIDVTQTHKFTARGTAYTENIQFRLACEGFGSDAMKVCKEETLQIGKHTANITDIFADGKLYTTVNNSHFSSKIAQGDYLQTMIPAVLMDYSLYNNISGVDSGEEYVIYLEEATKPEYWALPKGATFVKASGTAYIRYSGQIQKSIYFLDYTQEDITHRLTFISQWMEETPEVVIPSDTSLYTAIYYPEGPKMLERASGFLTQINNLHAVSKDTVYFEAFGDTREKTVDLEINDVLDLSANVQTNIILSNESRAGQDSIYQQTETFKNGVYAIETTDIPTAQNLEITEEQMRNYCLNLLVGTIMLPKDIVQCRVEESAGIIRITYTANQEFARQISSNACNTLYQNPDLITELAQTSIMDNMVGYLELESKTGLPLSSGIHYSCTYTAEELPYQFRFQADQTYRIAD